jgi:hypothetical protein
VARAHVAFVDIAMTRMAPVENLPRWHAMCFARRAMSTRKPSSRRARASSAPPPATDVVVEVPARHELVQLEAYLLAERRGFVPGGELDDWLEAERIVATRLT